MNLQEMLAMPLNSVVKVETPDHATDYAVQRVPNGWVYIYPHNAAFVPEPEPVHCVSHWTAEACEAMENVKSTTKAKGYRVRPVNNREPRN
jgi:hypothetical protein